MENRFQIITVYEDGASKTESVSDIQRALEAASIYWQDPECEMIQIYDWKKNINCLTYIKPE